MKSNLLYNIVILLLLFSCGNQNAHNGEALEDTTYYPNGSILAIQNLKYDSIKHGNFKMFHENGQLKIESEFIKGKRNGRSSEFYPDGTLKVVSHYQNDKLNGLTTWFFENGQIQAEALYRYDEQGPRTGYLYHKNGEVNAYVYFNQFDEVMYRVDYDEEGVIIKEEGTGFPEVVVNSVELHQGDTFEAEINVINPPHGQPVLYVGEKDHDGNLIEKEKVNLHQNQFVFRRLFETPGTIHFGALLLIESDQMNAKSEFDFKIEIQVIDENLRDP